MKVALVHDHLCHMGGAERVLAVLHRMYPSAPIFTALVRRSALWPELRDADIRTSWMQHLPRPHRTYRAWLPLYGPAIESFDLTEYDLVISSSSAFAKAAIVRPGARHVCYCHTPMRYAWRFDAYVERERFGPFARHALRPIVRRLKEWDVRTSRRVSHYIANSTTVAARIRASWGRDAEIVHPPVAVERYVPGREVGDYHLMVTRLVAYKRIDLAIDAFNALKRALYIVGDGPARRALELRAGPNVRFLGRVPDRDVAALYAGCRAFLFPGEEDFGIAPLEANAAGRPVIAYRAGGALDSVVDGETGVFIEEQSAAVLADAVARCDAVAWDAAALRRHALRFSESSFMERMRSAIARAPALPVEVAA